MSRPVEEVSWTRLWIFGLVVALLDSLTVWIRSWRKPCRTRHSYCVLRSCTSCCRVSSFYMSRFTVLSSLVLLLMMLKKWVMYSWRQAYLFHFNFYTKSTYVRSPPLRERETSQVEWVFSYIFIYFTLIYTECPKYYDFSGSCHAIIINAILSIFFHNKSPRTKRPQFLNRESSEQSPIEKVKHVIISIGSKRYQWVP